MPVQLTATLEFVPGQTASTRPMKPAAQVRLTNCSDAPSP